MDKLTGTERTKRFYEEKGWKEEGGESVDRKLFGTKEDGPIRVELYKLHMDRVRASLSSAGTPVNLLECGCGGNPDRQVVGLCSRYTGVDFSEVGLDMARASFIDVGIPYEFRAADVCKLPFQEGQFDAVYSAHMIYHRRSQGPGSGAGGVSPGRPAGWCRGHRRSQPAPASVSDPSGTPRVG